jgi:hypothetical protein
MTKSSQPYFRTIKRRVYVRRPTASQAKLPNITPSIIGRHVSEYDNGILMLFKSTCIAVVFVPLVVWSRAALEEYIIDIIQFWSNQRYRIATV